MIEEHNHDDSDIESDGFQKFLDDSLQQLCKRLTPRPSEGLLLIVAKSVLRHPFLWWQRTVFRQFALAAESVADRLLVRFSADYQSQAHADARRKLATDLYLLGMTVLLLVMYTVAYLSASSNLHHILAGGLLVATTLMSLLRLIDMMTFVLALHSLPTYRTTSRQRAIANTLWHYADVTIIFGVLYLSAYYLAGDKFYTPLQDSDGTSIVSGYLDAAYFSSITLTTVGYGDLSPTTWGGRLLVMSEIAIGILLLVVVLQRVMSAESKPVHLTHFVLGNSNYYAVEHNYAEPIGFFRDTERVKLLDDRGKRTLVESEQGVVAFVESNVLVELPADFWS